MTHLSPAEFVDLVEGTLAAARAGHVARCERCRAEAAAARDALEVARQADVPEPSPLFWDHFSARVRAGIDAEPIPVRRWTWVRWPVPVLGGVVAILVAAVTIPTWRGLENSEPGRPPDPVASLEELHADLLVSDDTVGDDPWDLVVSLARGLAWDEAMEAVMAVRPGTADGALLLLSAEERTALVGLLRAELPDVEG